MKGRARLLAAAGALAVLAGAWFLADTMAMEQTAALVEAEGQEKTEAEPIGLSIGGAEEIRALTWSRNGEEESLVRSETGLWQRKNDPECPIDQTVAGVLAEAAGNITAWAAIENVRDMELYGLTEPVLTLTVSTADASETYAIGGRNLGGEYYLRRGEEWVVYTESGGLLPAFSLEMEDLLALDEPPADIGAIRSLSVATEVGGYEMTEGESGWYAIAGQTQYPLGEEAAEELCGEIAGIQFLELVEWHGEGLETYGLDVPQGTAELAYVDRDGGERTFSLAFGDYADGNVYATIPESGRVYLVRGTVLDRLMYPDWEAMAPRGIVPEGVDGVIGAEVVLGGHTYEVEIITELQESGETLICYVSNGWTLDTAAARAWFSALLSLEGEQSAGTAEGREEILSATLRFSEEEMSSCKLTIRGYDSSRCLCEVNGERRYFLARETGETLAKEAERLFVIE